MITTDIPRMLLVLGPDVTRCIVAALCSTLLSAVFLLEQSVGKKVRQQQ